MHFVPTTPLDFAVIATRASMEMAASVYPTVRTKKTKQNKTKIIFEEDVVNDGFVLLLCSYRRSSES